MLRTCRASRATVYAAGSDDDGCQPLTSDDQHEAVDVVVPEDRLASARLRCGRCATDNHPRRMLCGGCGGALDGAHEEVASRRSQPPAGAPDDRAVRLRRWWLAPLAVLTVAAAILAMFAIAQLGPFAGAPAPPAPASLPAELGESGALELSGVATLTSRNARRPRRFVAEALVDGDPTTAWHADAEQLPPGGAETVDLYLERPAWVTGIVFENGDHLDSDAYAEHGRAHHIEVRFDGEVAYSASLLDLGRSPQIIELPVPALTTAVRVRILEVFAGDRRADPALTSVQVHGDVARGEDVRLAEERADAHPAAGVVVLPEA